jgi:hypothetical protein
MSHTLLVNVYQQQFASIVKFCFSIAKVKPPKYLEGAISTVRLSRITTHFFHLEVISAWNVTND